MTTFKNPILTGFHPDPSICRAGEDYYLTCSTFEYFPGLPIYHSRELVHWNQIGNALERPEQLPLEGIDPSLFFDIDGVYELSVRNPILTHRHLGHSYPIVNVGHADLVETQKEDWPVVAPGVGKIEKEVIAPLLPSSLFPDREDESNGFLSKLGTEWLSNLKDQKDSPESSTVDFKRYSYRAI